MNFFLTVMLLLAYAFIPVTRAKSTVTPPAANDSDITVAITAPSPSSTGGPVTSGGGRTADDTAVPTGIPQLPVWAKCLSTAPIDPPADSSVVSLFRHWCSNYDTVIPCVTAGLTTAAANNPLDAFVKLHFDSATLRTRSDKLCPTFRGLGSRLQCAQQNNGTLEAWCRARFSQGMQYVFAMQMQKAFGDEPNVYKELACQVTEDTSGCQGAAMTTCDAEVKGHLIAYYSLLSNETCVADPTIPYTTPAPPPASKPLSNDVVVTCAQRVAQTVPFNETLAQNVTLLQQLTYGLRQNCRSFEARYNCYDEELDRISSPSFRDIWLSFTFDTANAIKSQKQFCQAFEGGVISQLNEECYKNTQPSLLRCEGQYGNAVVSLQRQYTDRQLDDVSLHKSACRASLQRAFCLRDVFKQCSAALSETMLASELGTLPDICLTLPTTGTSSSSSNNRNTAEPIPSAETTDDDSTHSSYTQDAKTAGRVPGEDERKFSPAAGVSADGATVRQSTGRRSGASCLSCSLASLILALGFCLNVWWK